MNVEKKMIDSISQYEKSNNIYALANALENLGIYYQEKAMYQKVIPIYERALDIWQHVSSSKEPAIATLMVNLGYAYLQLQNLEKANPLFQKALCIFEEDVTFEDEGVVDSFYLYLQHLKKSKNYQVELKSLMSRVKQISHLVHHKIHV